MYRYQIYTYNSEKFIGLSFKDGQLLDVEIPNLYI